MRGSYSQVMGKAFSANLKSNQGTVESMCELYVIALNKKTERKPIAYSRYNQDRVKSIRELFALTDAKIERQRLDGVMVDLLGLINWVCSLNLKLPAREYERLTSPIVNRIFKK